MKGKDLMAELSMWIWNGPARSLFNQLIEGGDILGLVSILIALFSPWIQVISIAQISFFTQEGAWCVLIAL